MPCETCKHFATDAETKPLGVCRRYPPTIASTFPDEPWRFPVVHQSSVCGEESSQEK